MNYYPKHYCGIFGVYGHPNAAELESYATGDGEAWKATAGSFLANADLSFGLLGTELWSPAGARLALKAYRRLGRRGLLEFTGGLLVSCRDWASDTFGSERAHVACQLELKVDQIPAKLPTDKRGIFARFVLNN